MNSEERSMSDGQNLPARIDSFAVMQFDRDQLREVITENIGTSGISHLDLDRVHVPTAGGTTWSVPNLDGEKSEKTLRGVIGYQTVARGYWEALFEDGGGEPPSCYSNDGRVGVGNPGGDCSTCKFNQWGSDRRGGKGKACRELRLLFLLQEDSFLPMVVALPPTSVKNAHHYLVRLASKGVPYYGVITEISLTKEKSDNGISYAKAEFKSVGRLDPEQTAKMRAYKEVISTTLAKSIVVTSNDVESDTRGEDSDPEF
jgi:hypothetical protein